MELTKELRNHIEKDFNLEAGSTDGLSLVEIEKMAGVEAGALDSYIMEA